jgi:O-antigen/teichoic acid export membrane protein
MLLAAGPRRTFVLVETVAQATFVAVSAVLLPYLGIEAAGVALLCAYAVHLPLSFMAVSRLSGFRWSPEVMRRFWILLSLAVAIFAVVFVNEVAAAFIAIPSSAVLFALWASRMIKLVIAPDVADGDTSRDA